MLFLKQLRDYRYALITTGGATVYDSGGNLQNENVELSQDIINGAQRVSGISVLSFDGGSGEVAIEGGNNLKKYRADFNLVNLVSELMVSDYKFICHLKSKGKIEDTRYRQNIFIYPEDFNCLSLLKSLTGSLEEVTY